MKFPGQRKSKHYFPVSLRDPLLQPIKERLDDGENCQSYIVGIDQTLVDIEAKVDDAFIERYQLSKGHSLVIEDDVAEALYKELTSNALITHEYAGEPSGIRCITTPCWRMIARCYWERCAITFKLEATLIAIYAIHRAAWISTIYKGSMGQLVAALPLLLKTVREPSRLAQGI